MSRVLTLLSFVALLLPTQLESQQRCEKHSGCPDFSYCQADGWCSEPNRPGILTLILRELIEDKDKVRHPDDEVILFEGPNCTENMVGSLPLNSEFNPFSIGFIRNGKHFDNDEAKSFLVRKTRNGAEIFLSDHPSGRETGRSRDDWIRVFLKDKDGFCVRTLDPRSDQPPRKDSIIEFDTPNYRGKRYYKNGRLGGKVSFARVTTDSPTRLRPPDKKWERKETMSDKGDDE